MNNLPTGKRIAIDIRDLFGREAFAALIYELGGQRIYIPALGTEGYWHFCERLGRNVTDYLSDNYAGLEIDFPSRFSLEREEQKRAMIPDLQNPNLTANVIARRFGVSRRHIHQLRRKMGFSNQTQDS